MSATSSPVIELLPEHGVVRQLFVLLHGVGASASSLLPLAMMLRQQFPDAALLLPEGFEPYDAGGQGRQWFSLAGITEQNRIERVAAQLPRLEAFVRGAQARFAVKGSETALAGFSQGAIMALALAGEHDGLAGRVLAFSGRYASLPERAPEFTTLHLLHGDEDRIMPVAQINEAFAHLSALQADVTLDVASGVGHTLHPALIETAINRLLTCVPLRVWKKAL